MWESLIVGKLRPVAAGLFRDATVLPHERNVVTVRLNEGVPLAQARRRGNEVEPILSELLDQTVRLEVTDPSSAPGPPPEDAAQPAEAAGPTPSAPSQESAASASTQQDKVQRIVDRFPGSVVVRDDEGVT